MASQSSKRQGSVNLGGAAERPIRDSQILEHPSANGRIPFEPSRLDPSPLTCTLPRHVRHRRPEQYSSAQGYITVWGSIRSVAEALPVPTGKNLDTAICWRASQVLGRRAGLAQNRKWRSRS